jgi:molecular chaperone DnaK
VQDLLALEERGDSDRGELDLAVSQLQEAMFGLNRRLLSERKSDQGPLQGLKNTLGTLKDELFADDDDWDDWSRPASDPWSSQRNWARSAYDRPSAREQSERRARWDQGRGYDEPSLEAGDYPPPAYAEPGYADIPDAGGYRREARSERSSRYDRFPETAEPATPVRLPRRTPDPRPLDDDPWAER